MMISFCIPVFNAKEYLKPCTESIYAQNLTGFEVICIDDCSRNLALKMSRGKYVWFVDAGDMLISDTADLY